MAQELPPGFGLDYSFLVGLGSSICHSKSDPQEMSDGVTNNNNEGNNLIIIINNGSHVPSQNPRPRAEHLHSTAFPGSFKVGPTSPLDSGAKGPGVGWEGLLLDLCY